MPTKVKNRRRIDPRSVDMPDLFGDLIRERSLYAVLESISRVCAERAVLRYEI